MVMVNLQHQHIICASQDAYGMNRSVQDEEVSSGWAKESNSGSIWDEEW